MKFKTLCAVMGAALLAAPVILNAQETAPAAASAKAPARTVEQMLAFIPEDVVSINGKIQVKRKELVDYLTPQLKQVIQFGSTIPDDEIKAAAINLAKNIGLQFVLTDHIKKLGITPDRAAVEKELQGYRKQWGNEAFEKMLKQQNIDYKTLVSRIAEVKAITKWQEQVLASAPGATEEEIKTFYENNKERYKTEKTFSASHILVKFSSEKPSPNEKKTALAKIEKIRKELLGGADFAAVARKESDCPSKEQGGNLGEFPEGRMVPEFENALKNMKENEISGPVETQFGYHIIKAGPRKEAGQKSLQEAKPEIKAMLTRQKHGEIMKKKADDLCRQYGMKILIK